MTRSFVSLRLIVPLLLVVPVAYRATGWLVRTDPKFKYDTEMSQQGKDLFLHEWTPGDPLAVAGDGLGPVFNAASCVACHRQGGAGGAGPNENNVTAFIAIPVASQTTSLSGRVSNKLVTKDAKQGVVHAFATQDEFRETLRNVASVFPAISQPPLGDILPAAQSGCVVAPRIGLAPGVDISQRNTPALFGASLIDAIPDRLVIANERTQRVKWGLADSNTEELPVGRALRLANGHVGKFGWKAQIGTLPDFVRAACANELGLGNPSQAQPASMAKRDYKAPGIDLTEAQCDQITAFVASLPRPVEPAAGADEHAASGKRTFQAIGCADCHTPNLGEAKGIYSDLLLHRMGRQLVGGGSYGDPPAELPEFPEGSGPQPSEWRTPPLWGVADSAPYLHDGRATTLTAAIQAHGGQAQKSAERFAALPAAERDGLLAFLNALRAPKVESPPQVEQFAQRSPTGGAEGTIVPAAAH